MTQFPEAMIRSIEQAEDPVLDELINQVDALVIGPGLGTKAWGKELLGRVMQYELPMLIDADGLNNLSALELNKANWVLTPHPGEASRLLHTSVADIEQDRFDAITRIQHKYSGSVVLKGAGTLVTDGQMITVCDRGNPGMATAGMGDILSGIIGSLLAQGLEPFLAARVGVSLHAMAGDEAAVAGEKVLLATDLLEPLRHLVNE
jgi:NAD(P)H-hydrate epimerase